MNQGKASCKGCGEQYRVTDEQIDRMLEKPMFRSAELCVPDNVYEERLEQCLRCSRLQAGQTCTVCGCFVRIAAKYRERACPLPGDSRWAKHTAI
jgi:hypothetical protein